jgi:hypothetical protein
VLSFATSCVLLTTTGCVFFVVHRGKGICRTLLGVCNGCVVCYVIGFDASGSPSTFGLFVVGLGNLG